MIKKILYLIFLSFVFLNLDINAMDRDKDQEFQEPPLKKVAVDSSSEVSEGKEQEAHPVSIDMSAQHRIDKTIIVKLNLAFNNHLDNVNFILGFPTLTDLDLSCCERLGDNYRPISQLTNLERLELYGTNLTTTEYLVPLKKLKYLDVWCPDLGRCIEHLSYLNLKELIISGNSWKGLIKLSLLKSLEIIKFKGFYTTEDDEDHNEEFPQINYLTNLVNLKSIDFSYVQYLTHIGPIINLPNLTSLNLSMCESIKDLILLDQIKSLRKLIVNREIIETLSIDLISSIEVIKYP